MLMFNALQTLFKMSNILAIIILISSYVFTIMAKKRRGRLASASFEFPVFGEQFAIIKQCYICGTVFILMAWLLCSASVLAVSPETIPSEVISGVIMSYATKWAMMFFAGIIAEIVLKFIKGPSDHSYSVMRGIKTTMWYSVIYFVLSFLIA